jgi:hypothetical protein
VGLSAVDTCTIDRQEATMSDTSRTGAIAGGERVAVNETDRLISLDKVEGTSVYSRAGESVGSVYTVMIDKYSGQVAYAVMSFGGVAPIKPDMRLGWLTAGR